MNKKIISINAMVFALVSCGDGPSVILTTTSSSASSTLASSANYTYEPKNALDGNASTAWVEGVKGDGLGESLQVTFDGKAKVKEFGIINGFAENHPTLGDLYPLNNRVKKLRIIFDDGEEMVELKDRTKELQVTKFAKPHESMGAKLIISEVYKGSKWDDTAISVVKFIGLGKGSPQNAPKDGGSTEKNTPKEEKKGSVTKENCNAVKTGMSKAQVIALLGETDSQSETEIGGAKSELWHYQDTGLEALATAKMEACDVHFDGNKVSMKSWTKL